MRALDPVSSIRRLGFRKWYERQLVESHAALVTCLLCGLTVVALVEEISFAAVGPRPLAMAAIMLGATLVGWLAWRHYITVLERAERYGQRSSCPGCEAYGRFDVVSSGLDSQPGPTAAAVAPLAAAWMRVKCRKCGVDWRVPE